VFPKGALDRLLNPPVLIRIKGGPIDADNPAEVVVFLDLGGKLFQVQAADELLQPVRKTLLDMMANGLGEA